jgi:hypothetical protein
MSALLGKSQQGIKALDDLDLTYQDLRDTVAQPGGLIAVVRQIDEAMGGNIEKIRLVTPEMRALRGVFNILAQDGVKVDDIMRKIGSGVEVLGERFRRTAEEPAFIFQQFLQTAKVSLIELGDAMAPTLVNILENLIDVLEGFSELVKAFGELPDAVQKATIAFIGFNAILGPMMLLLGNVITMFSKMPFLFKQISLASLTGGFTATAHAAKKFSGSMTFATLESGKFLKLGLGMAFKNLATAIGTVGAAIAKFLTPLTITAGVLTAVAFAIRDATKHQNELNKSFDESFVLTQSLGGVVKALGEEIRVATLGQREFNTEVRQAAIDALPGIIAEMTKAKEKLRELEEWNEKNRKGMAGLTKEHEQQIEIVDTLTGQYDNLNKKLQNASRFLPNVEIAVTAMDAAFEEAWESTFKTTDGLKTLSDEAQKLGDELAHQISQMTAMKAAYMQGAEAVEELEIHQAAVNTVMQAGISIQDAVASGLLDRAIAAERLRRELDKLRSVEEEILDLTTKTSIAFEDNSGTATAAEKAYAALNKILGSVNPSVLELNSLMDALTLALADVDDEIRDKILKSLEEWAKAQDNVTEETKKFGLEFGEAIAKAIIDADDFGDALKELFEGNLRASLVGTIEDIFNALEEAFEDAGDQSLSFGDVMRTVWKAIKGDAEDMGTTVESVMNAITAAANAASGETEDLWVGALTAISAFARGDFVGAIIATIGVIVGLLKDMTKSLQKRVEMFMKSVERGARSAADGVAKAVNAIVAGMGKSFKKGSNLIEKNLGDLIDLIIEFGGEGADSLRMIADAARETGIGLEEIKKQLREAREELADAIEARANFIRGEVDTLIEAISNMSLETAGAVQFAGSAVVAAFVAMLKAGAPLTEIVETLGEQLRRVGKAGKDLGVALGPQFERLQEVFRLIAENGLTKVVESLENVANATEAVGNLGLLTAQQFTFFANKVQAAFNALTEGGLTSAEAIAAMAPQLQLLNDLAEQYGVSVGGATKELLDQAKAQGLVTNKGLTMEDILIKGFDRMILALNRVIEALGGVPVAFDEVADSATTAFATSGDAVTEFVGHTSDQMQHLADDMQGQYDAMEEMAEGAAQSSFDAWSDALGDIPGVAGSIASQIAKKLKGIPISFKITTSGGGGGGGHGGGIQAQHGTGGILDFPSTGQMIEVHGREEVLTESAGDGVVAKVDNLLREFGGGGGEAMADALQRLTEAQMEANAESQTRSDQIERLLTRLQFGT